MNSFYHSFYSAFDLYPSAKGAAEHIQRMAEALFQEFEGGILSVVGNEAMPRIQEEGSIRIHRFISQKSNYLERALAFARENQQLLERFGSHLRICHFRDPWGGIPIVEEKSRYGYRIVYEVNALPSIELQEKYSLPSSTLKKLQNWETHCLEGADAIIVPSQVIYNCLTSRISDPAKISIIRNGGDAFLKTPSSSFNLESPLPKDYLLYFGAVQRWQGLDVLLRAFSHLLDKENLHLILCLSTDEKHAKPYLRLAEKLQITPHLRVFYQLPKDALMRVISGAKFTIAPLTECPRNFEQGCCPLKILESLALSVPVIASDLPVVRELLVDKTHGLLVRPDRPTELARTMRIAIDYPEEMKTMGQNGKMLVQEKLNWTRAQRELLAVYRQLIPRQNTASFLTLDRNQSV